MTRQEWYNHYLEKCVNFENNEATLTNPNPSRYLALQYDSGDITWLNASETIEAALAFLNDSDTLSDDESLVDLDTGKHIRLVRRIELAPKHAGHFDHFENSVGDPEQDHPWRG